MGFSNLLTSKLSYMYLSILFNLLSAKCNVTGLVTLEHKKCHVVACDGLKDRHSNISTIRPERNNLGWGRGGGGGQSEDY